MISKSAGGIGLSIHNIRATGSYIRGTNGTSNGILPMLRVFNDTARLACIEMLVTPSLTKTLPCTRGLARMHGRYMALRHPFRRIKPVWLNPTHACPIWNTLPKVLVGGKEKTQTSPHCFPHFCSPPS